MRKILYILLFCSFVVSLEGCRVHNEESDPVNPVETHVKIRARTTVFSSDLDSRIYSLRVMAFDVTTHRVSSNIYYTDLDGQLDHTIYVGTYDFVFIANEPNDESHTKLNGIFRYEDLQDVVFSATNFEDDKIIPMLLEVQDVEVLENNQGVKIGGGALVANWNINLQRLASRIDIVMKSMTDLSASFGGVAFANLADSVPLLRVYNGPHTTTRIYRTSVPEQNAHFRDTTIAGYAWAKIVDRVIVPSHEFLPVNDAERVAALEVILDDPENAMGCTLEVDKENSDYSLPHNVQLKVDAEVKFPMEVQVAVAPWTNQSIAGDVYTRQLSVSENTITVFDGAVSRLYFKTNQPSAYIEATGYTGASGTTTFNVNNEFDRISQTDATNFHFDSATGQGYVDINSISNTVGNRQHRIILNTNGLRRTILINTRISSLPTAVRYVSIFYRDTQTGERIISIPNTGAWTATVESGSAFIVLDRTHSPAMKAGILMTATPGDAEDFQITNGTTSVSGVGRVFFRVGMTSTTAASTVRFGAIRLITTTVNELIVVRQNHNATPIAGVNWRTMNLSDPDRGEGGNDFLLNTNLIRPQASPVVPEMFEDFPTKIGYMVRWNSFPAGNSNLGRYLNPFNPSQSLTNYPATTQFATTWATANDACPSGNRHPTSAEFSQLIAGTTAVRGFCADGFFDRRTIDSNAFVTGSVWWEIGAVGWVFYVPATYANVFFPVTGFRSSNGALQPRTWGMYSTSSIAASPNFLAFLINASVNNALAEPRTGAYPVRCVQN